MRGILFILAGLLTVGPVGFIVFDFFNLLSRDESIPSVRKDLATPQKPADPQVLPPPPTTVQLRVNSLGSERVQFNGWQQGVGLAGHIDTGTILIAGGRNVPTTRRPLTNDDILELSGWAGHVPRGMRIKDVLFSMCGQLVGRTNVSINRPDVAQKIHSNLSVSGWRARLAVVHLPRCADAELNAWAVSPFGTNIWRLEGKTNLNLSPAGTTPRQLTTILKPLLPTDIVPPQPSQLDVSGRLVNLRQCGNTDCKVVGKVARGRYLAYLVEQRNGWTLLQFGNVAGWISSGLIKVVTGKAPGR